MSQPAPSASQSDLITRFAAAVVMIAVACIAIFVGGWLFRLLVAAGAAAMIVEWGDMHRLKRGWSYFRVRTAGRGPARRRAISLPGRPGRLHRRRRGDHGLELPDSWLGFAAVAAAAALTTLASRRLSLGWGVLYVGIPSFALLVVEWASLYLVFWLMLVTWATDIFAYFAGRSIGGPKLAPKISPNKTWAGSRRRHGRGRRRRCGRRLAVRLRERPSRTSSGWGAPMGLLAQLGDLYESRVKRRLGVKDSGTLLPGHGGVLDRLDGLLPVILATLLVLIASLA
jgi:phosphatidate cytidylyltransferase